MLLVRQAWKACVLIILLSLAACQSPSRESGRRPNADAAASQPTTTQRVEGTDDTSRHVKPGKYMFTAKVRTAHVMRPNTRWKTIHGVGTISGERCLFTGFDVNWGIVLDVQKVDKPLWFLKAGEPLTVVVHSPYRLLHKPDWMAAGEVLDFSLSVSRVEDGTLRFGVEVTSDK